MTPHVDQTNQCSDHSLIHGCTKSLKEKFDRHLFDHREDDIQADGKHDALWTGIKENISKEFFFWVLTGVFISMMVLFGLNKEAISEVSKNNACTNAAIARIEKKVDRIAIEMKLKNWDELDGE